MAASSFKYQDGSSIGLIYQLSLMHDNSLLLDKQGVMLRLLNTSDEEDDNNTMLVRVLV